MTKLDRLNKRFESLRMKKDAALRELRETCWHLRLVEGTITGRKPHRICVDCGAEESGWYCGIHVLLIDGDTWCEARLRGDSRKELGALVSKSSDWIKHRKSGEPYFVGQSHPNFGRDGVHTYAELTEQ